MGVQYSIPCDVIDGIFQDIPFHEHMSSKAHILLPPKAAKTFEDLADIAQLKTKLIIEDYSE